MAQGATVCGPASSLVTKSDPAVKLGAVFVTWMTDMESLKVVLPPQAGKAFTAMVKVHEPVQPLLFV